MRGKAGLAIGLVAGYVLGTRAGRERYEQIKTQAQKVWNLDPVQKQVSKVKAFAASSAMALPSALWEGAVKVTKAAQKKGTAGDRLDAALAESKRSGKKVQRAAEETADEIARKAEALVDEADGRGGA